MNNNSLIKIINLYGGNANSNEYTESLLNKYNKIEENNITNKINNLKTLLVDDTKEINNIDKYSIKYIKKLIK